MNINELEFAVSIALILIIFSAIAYWYNRKEKKKKKQPRKVEFIDLTPCSGCTKCTKCQNIKISPKHFKPRPAHEKRLWKNKKNPDED